MRKRVWNGILVFIGMQVLILDGKTAMEGALQGIDLCIKTVIPSLFPFFFLSVLITNSLYGTQSGLLKPLGKLFGIPTGAESILMTGFLGGYPVGAQAAANLWRCGAVSRECAQRMLGFCSNAGPGFLFGIATSLFSEGWMAWSLWGIHIVSALAVSVMLPVSCSETVPLWDRKPMSMTDALQQSIRVMASVCGWILLFRVLVAFGDRWFLWMLSSPARACVIGMLELSNGCCELGRIASQSMRFILCSGMLAFGGCCVTMQTMSVTAGLSIRYYLWGKGIQTVLSCFLAWAVVKGFFPLSAVFLMGALFLLRKRQNRSSILCVSGV